jgi:hypothetical protein
MRELLEEVEKAGVLREEGRKLEGKSDGSVGGVRRIMWVFKDKSTAETYRPLLLMWYSKLLIMESELASRWTEPTNHGGLNSVTISLEERKHTETTTVAVAPSFPMHELESKGIFLNFYAPT